MEFVTGRILEDDRARRHVHAALDDLQYRAPRRAAGLPIDQPALDVLEATQGEEVVALVVVEGPLITKSFPDWVRIAVDLEVVRVVVDVGIGGGHLSSPSVACH